MAATGTAAPVTSAAAAGPAHATQDADPGQTPLLTIYGFSEQCWANSLELAFTLF